ADDLFPGSPVQPVVVADELDEASPDAWVIHVYFEQEPTSAELRRLRELGNGAPEVEHLEDSTDWVTRSQSGLRPIRAGRFFVHTPMHYSERPSDTLNFEIDAGLAFGTGQHAT